MLKPLLATLLFTSICVAQSPAPRPVAVRLVLSRRVDVDSASAVAALRAGLERRGTLRVVAQPPQPGDSLRLEVPELAMDVTLQAADSFITMAATVRNVATHERMPRVYVRARPDSVSSALDRFGETIAQLLATPGALTRTPSAAAGNHFWAPFGVHGGSPAGASVGVGVAYGPAEDLRAMFLFAEPGLHAGRLSLGYSAITGNLATGVTVRASTMRVYAGDDQRNYGGAEGQLVALLVGVRMGLFHSLGGSGRYLFTWDLGFGF